MEKITNYISPYLKHAKAVKAKIQKEHTFNLRDLHIWSCEQGTGDLLIVLKHEFADLFDYKFGWWEVDDAEVNIQMWVYVLGVFIENPRVKVVNVHVLQPARDEVGTATFERSQFDELLLRAQTIADRVKAKAGKEFNPVIENCLWCANKADCAALHEMVLRVRDQAKLTLPENEDLTVESFELAGGKTKTAGQVYDFADVIQKWASQVKWKITQLARDGHDIPNHHLQEVSGKRSVVDPVGAFEVLRDSYDLSLEEFLVCSNPSVTKMLKAAGAKAEHGEKANTQQAASASLMEAGVLTASAPTAYLVRDRTKKKGN